MQYRPTHERRRFQFSLSALFCLTLLVAIWAWGMRILEPADGFDGGSYGQNVGWIMFTAFTGIGIWVFVRAAACHQARAIGRRKTDDPSRDASP